MRRLFAVLGVIFLILGATLAIDSAIVQTASVVIGFSTQETVLDTGSRLYLVKPSGYTNVTLSLTSDDTLTAMVQANPSGIDLLLMNPGNFSNYASNSGSFYSIYPQSKFGLSNYSFTFNETGYSGNLVFVFVSHLPSSGGNTDVRFRANVVTTNTPSVLNYVPIGAAIFGLFLLALGLLTGFTGRKSGAQENQSAQSSRNLVGSKCRFCGADLNPNSVFCPACKKSQQ